MAYLGCNRFDLIGNLQLSKYHRSDIFRSKNNNNSSPKLYNRLKATTDLYERQRVHENFLNIY